MPMLPRELSGGEEDESFVKFCEFDLVMFDPEVALSMPSRTPEPDVGIL